MFSSIWELCEGACYLMTWLQLPRSSLRRPPLIDVRQKSASWRGLAIRIEETLSSILSVIFEEALSRDFLHDSL